MKYDPPPNMTVVEYEKHLHSLDHLFFKCIIEYVAKLPETGQTQSKPRYDAINRSKQWSD